MQISICHKSKSIPSNNVLTKLIRRNSKNPKKNWTNPKMRTLLEWGIKAIPKICHDHSLTCYGFAIHSKNDDDFPEKKNLWIIGMKASTFPFEFTEMRFLCVRSSLYRKIRCDNIVMQFNLSKLVHDKWIFWWAEIGFGGRIRAQIPVYHTNEIISIIFIMTKYFYVSSRIVTLSMTSERDKWQWEKWKRKTKLDCHNLSMINDKSEGPIDRPIIEN